MKNFIIGTGIMALAVLLSSCSSEPPKPVFVDDSKNLAHDERLPVKRIWKDPSAVMAGYDKIMIADVRTDLQLEKSWLEHNGASAVFGHEEKDLQELAAYMKESFSNAVRKGPCRMKLVEKGGSGTVALELAIVKVVANKPFLEVGSTVGMAIFRPISLCLVPVRSVISHETKSPLSSYIAIEGKIRDAKTGKELILFTTDAHEEGALLDINKNVSLYANVREIIDRWSLALVEVINRRPLETGDKVESFQPGDHDYTLLKL